MATISDVARRAGVSRTTVSRVLNHPETVAEEKRARVLAAIEELGYRPNVSARNLRRGAFGVLALCVGDVSQPFHGQLTKAVQKAAEKHGYSVLLYDLDNRSDRLTAFLEGLPHRGVDGVLIATADDLTAPAVRSAIGAVLEAGVFVVSTGTAVDDSAVPAIVSDNTAMGAEATRHLLDQDLWPVAFLGGRRSSTLSAELRAGYLTACRRAGRAPQNWMYLSGAFQSEPARRAVVRLLQERPEVRALVAANAPMAVGAMRAAGELGLRIPEDLAVVCCEDVELSMYTSPPLTAVALDLEELGGRAVDTLVAVLAGEKADRATRIPHHLVVRESSLTGA
ncbi:LacI family DNA-binding transcriptional regulator [Streptomyces sp. NPDC000151]|uniref:LacI family DNA-binding transcriptional regulator n=1 Tax=Streptomyces sp. NPDC000151 TaxID=3154244 RepID=UPI00332649CF